jgi:glycosyltransferase involved in cell wall biosynthesis
MVAYHYPPEGGSSGVLRTLKFSKYLPEYGWQPHVLTLRESFYAVRDDRLLLDIPEEVRVHRTFGIDTVRHLGFRGRHLALLAIPDRLVGWIPFAVARGLRVIGREGIDALYSTCPAPSAHLIAWLLHRITGVPWLADYRDPWIEEGIFPKPGTLRYKFESSLEAKVIRDCTYMIATTPHLAREFANRYPYFNEKRFRVVFNGYDEADFTGLNGSSWPKQFEIIHAGLLSRSYRNPFGFLEVVSELLKKGLLPPALLRISFIGSGSWADSDEFRRGIEGLGLEQIVKIENRVSHREALERMASAAVLLLMQASDDTRALIPAKAFEYLRVGRPILSLTLPGATAELLQDVVNCFTVDPSDRQSLAAALLALHRSWSDRCVTAVVARHLDRYERRNLTRELSNVLNMAVSGTRS